MAINYYTDIVELSIFIPNLYLVPYMVLDLRRISLPALNTCEQEDFIGFDAVERK